MSEPQARAPYGVLVLHGLTSSLASVTPNDGRTWLPSDGCGSIDDHQTVGGGPYAGHPRKLGTYPHAIYYCAHSGTDAFCSRT